MRRAVKICGLSTLDTLDAAISGGASHVGFNFFPPSPRALAPDRAAALAERARGATVRVGVFVDPDDALLDTTAPFLDAIQLNATAPDRVAAVRARYRREIWAVVAVKTRADLDAARARSRARPTGFSMTPRPRRALRSPAGWGCGSTGRCSTASRIRCRGCSRAGSTRRTSPRRSVAPARPMVDVSSGVERAPGVKDVDKIAAFLHAAAV